MIFVVLWRRGCQRSRRMGVSGRLTWLLLCVVSCGWLPSLAAQSSQWVLPDLPGPLVQRVLFDSAAAGQQVSCYVSLPPEYDSRPQHHKNHPPASSHCESAFIAKQKHGVYEF
ncbi:MAG: hypothetical protein ACKPJD_31785 [Planctomycetaceae bacterium]